MLRFITILLIRLKLLKSLFRDFSAHKIRFTRVYRRFSLHQSCFAGAQTDDFAQNSTEHFVRYYIYHINDRLVSLSCMTGLPTQHALRALNVPVFCWSWSWPKVPYIAMPVYMYNKLLKNPLKSSVRHGMATCMSIWRLWLFSVHKFTASLHSATYSTCS